MNDFIGLNGQIIPADEARISLFDAGLLHGAGLFETLRVLNKTPLNLSDHLHRMTDSARCLGLDVALDLTLTADLITELLEANDMTEARLRITITRGDTRDPSPDSPPTVMMSVTEYQPYPDALYQQGMAVIISRYAQNPLGPLTGHKSTSYMDRLLALREARAVHAGEALWFTAPEKLLAEGCISNVFIIAADGHIFTPPWQHPVSAPNATAEGDFAPRLALPGITRRHILRLCAENKLPATEKMLTIHDVLAAKEIFLTNAIMGVMPVSHIERHAVGDGKAGTVTRQLSQWYNAFIQEQGHGKET
jgi:branched-subunit amino acid aminotransferase/4-amino-4-deoxychorismate lyase